MNVIVLSDVVPPSIRTSLICTFSLWINLTSTQQADFRDFSPPFTAKTTSEPVYFYIKPNLLLTVNYPKNCASDVSVNSCHLIQDFHTVLHCVSTVRCLG